MKKLISGVLIGLMLLGGTMGCKLKIESNSNVKETYPRNISNVNGKIMLNAGFDNELFGQFMKATEKLQDYHIVVNSFGGSAYDTLSIINRIEELQKSGATITTEVYGYAMSAGAAILMAGDKRIVHTGSAIMFHCARIGNMYKQYTAKSEGTPGYIRDALNIVDDVLRDMLKEKTYMSNADIEHWLFFEDSNFMTAKEAKMLNVATELR